jgi:single-stranded-DNA-specific exonuclease
MPIRNSNTSWIFPELIDVPGHFQSEVGGYSIISQTLQRRGLTDLAAAKGFLDPNHYQPAPPTDLPGLSHAAERIQAAIQKSESILIWGDFDVDGQTSTTLLASGLGELGAQVFHYIPNRANESHGISMDSLAFLTQKYHPGLILTCDTGIDAHDSIAYANLAGIDVIITDHHQLPANLPAALSIINPALLAPGHALASLPGVGVAYKLIEQLFAFFGRDPAPYLDLVALGIVADVAQLTKDTRYLLQKGIPVLQQTNRLGLRLLYENANLNASEMSVDQIAFAIAPRLNALGRLSDANTCVAFFTSSEPERVALLAKQLESLNLQRQEITDRIYQEAQEMIASFPELEEDYPVLILQGSADWNPGVVGIVASRLVERYHKPTIILTRDGDQSRGSARSVPGINISDLINRCQELLSSHGGHPMAAGLALPLDKVAQFRRELSATYKSIYGDTPLAIEIYLDGELPFSSINPDFISDITRLAPFGAGNPKLLFATRNIRLVNERTIGKKENHRKLSLLDSSGARQDFLWWNSAGIKLPNGPFDIAYALDLSTYRGETQVQGTLQYFRTTDQAPVYITKSRSLDILDFRQDKKPVKKLAEIIDTYQPTLIWSEHINPEGYDAHPRLAISPSRTLIVWSIPPSLAVFKNAIDQADPEKLILFAEDPGLSTQKSFLEALIGLVKHAQETGKPYNSAKFAQRIAYTPSVIETGLDWLHHHGDFDLSAFRSGNSIKPGPGKPKPGFDEINQRLNLVLHEIYAYRAYFKKANIHSIF